MPILNWWFTWNSRNWEFESIFNSLNGESCQPYQPPGTRIQLNFTICMLLPIRDDEMSTTQVWSEMIYCRCHDEQWQQTEPISTVQSFNFCWLFDSHKIEHSMSTTVFFRRCLPLPRRRWLPPRVSGRLPSPAATAAHFSTLLRRQYLLKARCSLIS